MERKRIIKIIRKLSKGYEVDLEFVKGEAKAVRKRLVRELLFLQFFSSLISDESPNKITFKLFTI